MTKEQARNLRVGDQIKVTRTYTAYGQRLQGKIVEVVHPMDRHYNEILVKIVDEEARDALRNYYITPSRISFIKYKEDTEIIL